MFDDNKKIGMGLLGLSFLFISLGVIFLLDSTLIAIGACRLPVPPCMCAEQAGPPSISAACTASLSNVYQ